MNESILEIIAAVSAIALGLFNFYKHRLIERDMKRYPMLIQLEIAFNDKYQPKVTVKGVKRTHRQMTDQFIGDMEAE